MGNGAMFGKSVITAEEVVKGKDLSNLHYFITGSNVGIGLESARVLYNCGAYITLAGRDKNKINEAIKKIEDQKPKECKGRLDWIELDLNSLEKIKKCVEDYSKFETKNKPIDVLINNAGIMMVPQGKTTDGFESHIGVNHFGHFYLTNLLLPYIKDGGRIVCLSSYAHTMTSKFDLEKDLEFQVSSYNSGKAYARSKISNLLFAWKLNEILKENKRDITCFSVHPGVIATELTRYSGLAKFGYWIMTPFLKSIPQGASTQVFCATDENLIKQKDKFGGEYFSDCKLTILGEGRSELACDKEFRDNLWNISLKRLNITNFDVTKKDPSLQ